MRKIKIVTCLISLIGLISLIRPAAAAAAASLSLSPASATHNLNGIFTVDIVLDTGGDAVSGATAMLTFDTTKLSVQDSDPATAGIQIRPGPVLGQLPVAGSNSVDAAAGTIRYDAGTAGTTYTGRGVLATITLKAIAQGTGQVNFVFNPSSTTNTSLVAAASGPTNLLTVVNNGVYTIGSGYTAPPSLPPTGVVENTLAILGGGVLFLGVGLFMARRSILGV